MGSCFCYTQLCCILRRVADYSVGTGSAALQFWLRRGET